MPAPALQIPVLMYHYVGDAPSDEDFPYFVTEANFVQQLRFLRWGGYRSITPGQLIDALDGNGRLPQRAVLITFDDGHESFETLAAPALQRFGFSATMFVITERIDQPGYLSGASMRRLRERGMQFESHTVSHPILTQLPEAEARREIAASKRDLEAALGAPVRFFAYRGGHFNEAVQRLVREAGYQAAFCSEPAIADAASDRFALPRLGIRGKDCLLAFGRRLSAGRIWHPGLVMTRHFLRI